MSAVRRSITAALVAPIVAAVPRVTVDIGEACAALGVSRDFFGEHIEGELRMIRRGRKKLIPVAELEAWAMREAKRTIEGAS